ncbi:MAG: alpha/beta fold hydrolase [Acidobacteriota bacterium]
MRPVIRAVCLVITSLIFILPLPIIASAQEPPAKETTRAQMAEFLRYVELDQKTTPAEVDKLTDLWIRAGQAGLSSPDRQTAFRDLYLAYLKLTGFDLSSNPQRLTGLVQFAVSTFEKGGRMDLRLPERRGKIDGDYIQVETQGRGPTPVLLIADGGMDGVELYRSFIERNKTRYTMQVVTLPGIGKGRPLPHPEVYDPTRKPWLNSIEQSLVKLLDKQKEKMVVIGTAMGGYFAARLAAVKPEKIRAVILVDALVNMPMRSRVTPDQPASLQERLAIVKTITPAPFMFPMGTVPGPDEIKKLLDDPKNAHPAVQNWMSFAVKDDAVSKRWSFQTLSAGFFANGARYTPELQATDLTDDLKNLSVPMLAMCALVDDKSPRAPLAAITQWETMKMLYPTIPLTVITFADTRSYISEERPAEFDKALSDFLAGKPVVRNDLPAWYSRPSPRASIAQEIGATRVTITYGRPNLQGRELNQLPKGRVWRAGANEATSITFSTDVNIEGQKLAAGTYTFFAIPNEQDWTIIFNKVKLQWGAFDYNSTFDALRVKVQSQMAEPQEWLNYSFEPTNEKTAKLVLHWGKLKLLINLESLV